MEINNIDNFNNNQNYIKSQLLKIFHTKSIELDTLQSSMFSKNDRFADINTEQLLNITIPFIKAYYYINTDAVRCKDNIETFMSDYIQLSGEEMPQELLSVHKRILNNLYERSDKILLARINKEFIFKFIDWEDREYLFKILKYAFCKSLQMYSWLLKEEMVVNYTQDSGKKPYTFQINGCGHKNKVIDSIKPIAVHPTNASELLVRRIKPTMTLDAYADLVLEDMKKRENIKLENEEGQEVKNEEKVILRSEAIKQDEINDNKRCNLGNTKRIG